MIGGVIALHYWTPSVSSCWHADKMMIKRFKWDNEPSSVGESALRFITSLGLTWKKEPSKFHCLLQFVLWSLRSLPPSSVTPICQSFPLFVPSQMLKIQIRMINSKTIYMDRMHFYQISFRLCSFQEPTISKEFVISLPSPPFSVKDPYFFVVEKTSCQFLSQSILCLCWVFKSI